MNDNLPLCCSFVNGQWRRSAGESVAVLNPANHRQVVAHCRYADAGLAKSAMNAAVGSFEKWSRQSVKHRCSILRRAIDLLEANTDLVSRTITLENGKTLKESRSEVEATLKDARYQLQAVAETDWRIPGNGNTSGSDHYVQREPVGTFLLITPWNFPLATIVRKLVPALCFGNTVVVKPAQLTPGAACHWFEFLVQAGLPEGVADLALGRGSAIGEALIGHSALAGISFTGSTEVGLGICRQAAERSVRLQMEMGGKNAIVVLADADLDRAVEATALAAFSCAGQWCTSTSRAIVEAPVYESFLQKLKSRIDKIQIGDGWKETTTMGPVISEDQRSICLGAIEKAQSEGAVLLTGGRAVNVIDGKTGYYLEPTVFRDVQPEYSLAREEVFGPVLAVMPVENAEKALELANATDYGLTFSIYTRSPEWADRFLNEIKAGVCHVNLPTAYRDAAYPIGGWKESGRGILECGDEQKHLYTRLKTVYRSLP